MTPPARILFNGKDHPDLNSGYGIASRYLLPRLGDYYGKENVIIYAPIYQRDCVSEWQGMRVVGGNEFSYGEGMILNHYTNYNCNLLVQMGDTWPLGLLPDLASQDKVLWVQWIAVDWLGMPKNITYRIKPAHKLISFSKYGESSLRKAGLPNVGETIPIGINTNMWRPISRDDLPLVMKSLGYEANSFNLLIVAANQIRKKVREQLEAISIFRKSYPQVVVKLYLHSQIKGERDLMADIDELELKDVVNFPDPYIMTQGGFAEDQMVKVFNCADVVLNVCIEGFGLSQLQAQACGVPVICLSEGAGPELVTFGVETPPISVETSASQMSQPVPNPLAIVKALEGLWERRQKEGKPLRSEGAIKVVRENFSWDKVAQRWFGVIDGCMEDREKYCMDIPPPDEELDKRAITLVEVF